MDSIFDYQHPYVCTDAVIFSLKTQEVNSYRRLPEIALQVLLYRRDEEPFVDKWCLPGGFLDIDELPEDNIRRKLSSKAELEDCWLEQLFTFCELQRDPRARVISITYLGLMRPQEALNYSGKATWLEVTELAKANLGFDHYQIIKTALQRLQAKVTYTDIIFRLLPPEFTLTQLQNVYEAITGEKQQTANFRRKIRPLVTETQLYTGEKGHRPAMIYREK